MSYQPRFNKGEEPVEKTSPAKVLVVLAVALVSLLLTSGLLALMFLNVGRPSTAVEVKTADLNIMDMPLVMNRIK